ncbi:MAG: alpha,alpha-trehalose-phosphate synthase (UDP-forming) [Proteobacteria bacterium]|nr:alpha,alpha-trehalose-phosphate synthase (UDP-forming) [Pseudomonadota bacterium]
MSRLIVVSNRVALPGQNQPGGLAVGIDAALRARGGVWFGWSGKVARDGSGAVDEYRDGAIRYVTLDLSRRDVADYYNGFSNRTLWPLLHFRLDLVDYDRATRAGYRRVNALFAEKLLPLLHEDDVVWIHDYHLIPLAAMLREHGVGCRIGFFLHVPMPSADLVAALPDHGRLFNALFACDLVGFQTARDADRFRSYARLFAHARILEDGTLQFADGRRVKVGAFPIGIDTARITAQSAAAVNKPPVRALRQSLGGRALAIGVDRLDYSKGLPERFRAFGRFIERHPAFRGKLTFLQIAPVSRGEVSEYKLLRDQLEGIAGHINGNHADPDWTPLRYVNRNFPHSTLTGFYRAAAIGLVTPLRDGMNLVAKEYVAAQDRDDPGVLVLSLLAGAALELDGALLVNPHDLDGVADAIAIAMAMPLAERKERWNSLMVPIAGNDIHAWCSGYLAALADSR